MPEKPMNSLPPTPPPRRRRARRWPKVLLALLVLAVIGYFGLTSQAFLKAVVLPRVGAALNAKVTATGVSLSPFSRLRLKELRVETTGEQPLVRAEAVDVRYRLLSLLGGSIALPEVTLVNPVLMVVRGADGSSNLDPLLAGETEPPPAARGRQPPEVDIGSVTIRSGVVGICDQDAAGLRSCSVISNLDLTLTDFRNDATGKVTVTAIVLQSQGHSTGSPDAARGQLDGTMDFALARNLMPRELKGELGLEFTEAEGELAELRGWSGRMNVELTPQELRELALRFRRQGQPLGEARFRGPMDLARRTGRVDFNVTSVGRTALNLVGAPLGLDFGGTTLEASGFCDIANRGRRITANIKLGARDFSVRQGGQVTPPLDVQFEIRGNADLEGKTAYVDKLSLSGTQAGQALLSLETLRALTITWRPGEQPSTAPGIIQAQVSDLRLADWRSLLSSNIQDGIVNLSATISSSQLGRQMSADVTNRVHGLSVALGATSLENVLMEMSGTLSLSDFRVASLERGTFTYGEGTNHLVTATLSASHDPRTSSGNAQLTADADVAVLLARHPLPNLAFDRGSLRSTVLMSWGRDQYTGNVSLLAGDVNGSVAGYQLSGYSAQFEAAGELQRDKFSVRRLGLTAREGTRAGGSAEAVGELDGANQTARFTLNITALSQSALRPFIAPLLTAHSLESVSVDATGEFEFDAQDVPPVTLDYLPRLERLMEQLQAGAGNTSLRLSASTTNLVLRDRVSAQASPATGFGLWLDAERRGQVIELGKSNRFQLPATPRAQNELLLAGQLDLAPTNPTPSTLTARSSGLDLTELYDLVTFLASADARRAQPSPGPAAQPAFDAEPDPIALPLRQLTADLQVDALYLREITARDWKMKAVVEDNKLTLAPATLVLNNAPVAAQASLDLGRPGYVYDLRLDADGVPLEPIVNSTAPAYQGQVQGDLYSRLRIAGAGVTGPNLQKNLHGMARLSCTNLNFEIVTPRAKRLLTTLATALRIEDLARSPLTLLATDLVITNGAIQVQPFVAASDAFFATAEGAIRLAPVFTNSTVNLPLQLALREDLARQIKLANLAPSARSNYLALPPLVRLSGTVGAPETEIDKLRLAALLAGTLGGNLGGQAGTALQGVNSLLQGDAQGALGTLNTLLERPKPAASTNAPSTNAPPTAPAAPATNASGLRRLQDLLRPNN